MKSATRKRASAKSRADYTPAGCIIRMARRESAMSLQDLAQASGVSVGRLSEYENGKREPSVDMFLRILAATYHTIQLVDSSTDSDFANPYVNGRKLAEVLTLADAFSAAYAEPELAVQ